MHACMDGCTYVRTYVLLRTNIAATNIVWYRLPVDELPIKRGLLFQKLRNGLPETIEKQHEENQPQKASHIDAS